jgi:AraC family transcriptional regulator
MKRPDSTHDVYRHRVDQIVDYITDNLNETLDLSHLAVLSHFSPYHFHHIFKAVMGETPQDFINRLRLERAANLLLKTNNLSITQIALKCGFSSSSTFARAFKKHFGISASSYARAYADNPDRPIFNRNLQNTAQSPATPDAEISVRPMPALHLVYVANLKGYSLKEICRAWNKLQHWSSAHGLLTPETLAVGISFDDPLITPLEKCRYYACLSAPPETRADSLVNVIDIPAHRCVVSHVVCDAEQIERIYHCLYRDWFPGSGFQPADYPCYEIYRQTPENSPDGKYVMDVCIPIIPI